MPPNHNQQNHNSYDDTQIVRLEPREHVRKRPGMYIGGTDKRALHHMLWEVLDNSIEEAMMNRCSEILIQLLPNQTVCISDNSHGLPVETSEETKGLSMAEYMMTNWSHKPGFDQEYYGVSGGLHGVGLWAVNTLSTYCQLENKRDGFLWRQSYSEGLATSPFDKIRSLEAGETTGISITFRPDFSILDENDFDLEFIAYRAQELAFLHSKVRITVQDKRETEREVSYHYPNGLLDLINFRAENEITVHAPMTLQYQTINQSPILGNYVVGLDLAFQYIEASYTIEQSFINSVPIAEGGSHLDGLKNALIKCLSSERLQLDKTNVMRGLIVIINLRHPDPQFGSPTKVTLMNADVQRIVENAIEALFAAHPDAKAAIQAHFERMA